MVLVQVGMTLFGLLKCHHQVPCAYLCECFRSFCLYCAMVAYELNQIDMQHKEQVFLYIRIAVLEEYSIWKA